VRRLAIAILSVFYVAIYPLAASAAGPQNKIEWGKAVYPYKDLPGVTAPKLPEEKFKCSTRLAEAPYGFYAFRHDYPRLVYVCDQNGVISESTRPPNYDYWQYNGRNR
jgi:hypothetical protein